MSRSDLAIFIAQEDAKAVGGSDYDRERVRVIPNGVYLADRTLGRGRSRDEANPVLSFHGNLGYGANRVAASWLFENVFKPLRAESFPTLELRLVGRNPPVEIEQLGNTDGCTVTGAVDDIWEELSKADICVFPMSGGAGVQNKVLEGLSLGIPVVTSAEGNEGIDAEPGREIIVCDTPNDYQSEIARLLTDRTYAATVGLAGHDFVLRRFSWDQILHEFEDVLGTLEHPPDQPMG